MDHDFWLQKWEGNDIGFHEHEANPALVDNFRELSLEKGARIFLPLCGKTLDIAWLLSKGCHISGAELSTVAIEQLFAELGVEPQISDLGRIKHYNTENVDIYGGDIFDLSAEILGSVDAIYDRAALVALPGKMRSRYTVHLMEITRKAPQLLITFVYDQTLLPGPPFSVTDAEVSNHYSDYYQLKLLEIKDVPGGLKGQCPAREHVWLLNKG
ncbi:MULTISPECIES: thiopurine S-methyltransferase [unclassified Microbulbifer]|uniref:thiopurine S-methyltransferase n=1 Tax=unclassified Microbulbifer TaxID=2619833 RepID=UPI0027E43AA2|nr:MULTISPECIES: thiopurine S-methyltransferase [unclassified Microbulbifer]